MKAFVMKVNYEDLTEIAFSFDAAPLNIIWALLFHAKIYGKK